MDSVLGSLPDAGGSREGANAIFEEWQIDEEQGEVAIRLEGDVGLVPRP